MTLLDYENKILTTIDELRELPLHKLDQQNQMLKKAFDIGVSAIYNVGQTTNEGASIPITVDVTNFGTDTIIGFQVDYQVNNGSF